MGWQIVDAREMRGSRPALLWRDHLARVFILVILIMGRSLGLFVGLISSILEGGRRKIPKKVDVKVDFKMNRV